MSKATDQPAATPLARRGAAVRDGRAGARAALSAGRRAQGGAADGAAPAAARSRRRRAPRPRAAACGADGPSLRALQHVHRGRAVRAMPVGQARRALLCVVETPADLLMVEQTQAYSGLYFVLMGRLSPLDGIGPKEIRLERLIKRATDGVVTRSGARDQFHQRGRGDCALHRRAPRRARARGEPTRARRPGRRRARVRRQRHACAGVARAAAAGVVSRPATAVRECAGRPARRRGRRGLIRTSAV